MNIREIEKIIDSLHKHHPAFSGLKEQVIYEVLTVFEDICSLNVMGSMLNPCLLQKNTNYLDALNQALFWIENSNLSLESLPINRDISEEKYKNCASLLLDYAYPYSVICSGYISFSRNRLIAKVDNNTITFDFPDDYNCSAWNDIIREASQSTLDDMINAINPFKISNAYATLQKSIRIEKGDITYNISEEIFNLFLEIAEMHWEATKTLPVSWKFDNFTLDEYKKAWISIAAICYIHFFSDLKIQDPQIRIRNSIITMPLSQIIEYVIKISGLEKQTVEKIIKYITFEPRKKNIDIMYQPIIVLNDDTALIAPMLFINSRPERNLLAVVCTKKDSEHSKEVNKLEKLMVQELESVIPHLNTLRIVKHKNLGGRLPDIDFAILDTTTNSALMCELKWFIAADSTKEVYAREDDITHGCEQSDMVMAYAMSDRKRFIKQVFNYDDGANVDLFCCVVARHNIRTQHPYIPVIDLSKLKKLFMTQPINKVFHTIREHKYEDSLPDDASITYQSVKYGDFTFKIPAICFGTMPL